MAVDTPERPRATDGAPPPRSVRMLEWPGVAGLYALGLLVVYAPALVYTVRLWFTSDSYSHAVFVPPVAALLIALRRREIRRATMRPTAWGLAPLSAGLAALCASWLLRVPQLALWTLIPVLAGMTLVLHGPELWRIARFSILFLAFAAPLPFLVMQDLTLWVRGASTGGAVMLMQLLGWTVQQTGNQVDIPGHALEVADVCSGYKKLVALVAFSVLYAHLFRIAPWKRAVLALAAVPVAVVANAVRVAALIAVTAAWGEAGLRIAHDWAEIVVLGLAFVLFVGAGRALGCRNPRFWQQPDC